MSVQPCPCESRKPAKQCCLTSDGRWVMREANTKPPAPKTDLVSDGCYGAILRDCDGKALTREHYMSSAVLKKLGSELIMGGFPWNPSNDSRPVGSMVARILCKRHNEALSPLDAQACRLFSVLMDASEGRTRSHSLFNGLDIERWLLKTLCGLIASKSPYKKGEIVGNKLPDRWVRVLFGNRVMPERWGLHIVSRNPTDPPAKGDIEVEIGDSDVMHEPKGMTLALRGMRFRLQMSNGLEIEGRRSFYRPRKVLVAGVLEFHWSDPMFDRTLQVEGRIRKAPDVR
jgi:hypothetical protein